MSENRFRIITTGQIIDGFDRKIVESNLVQLCKFRPEKLSKVFTGKKFVFKTNLKNEEIKKYLRVLTKSGIACKVERVQPELSNRIKIASSTLSASKQSSHLTPGTKFLYFRLFPYTFVVVGVILSIVGMLRLVKATASVDWPATQGIVVASSVKYKKSGDGGGGTYHAVVIYDFNVDGKVFSGNRVAYGDYGSGDNTHARRIVQRYPQGRSVPVYYEPGNPGECLLKPGLKGQAWGLPLIGFVFFTVGSLMAIFLPRIEWEQATTKHGAGQIPYDEVRALFHGEKKHESTQGNKRIELERYTPRQVGCPSSPIAFIFGFVFGLAVMLPGLYLATQGWSGALRQEAIPAGAFIASLGGALIWRTLKAILLYKRRKNSSPSQPWSYDNPWKQSGTEDNNYKRAFKLLHIALVFSLLIIPLNFMIMRSVHKEIMLFILIGLFDLVLLFIIVRVAYLFSVAFKYGKVKIRFHSFPFFAGEELTITFVTEKHLCNQPMHAELQCIKEYSEWEGSRENRSTRQVYEQVYAQKCEFSTDAWGRAHLNFHLPEDAISTDLLGDPPHYWELEISAEVRGIDYQGIFLMPVYQRN